MRIVCEKGFYKFFPQKIMDVTRWESKTGAELAECEDYFTFKTLANLPNYSLLGHRYSGLFLGLSNYAGKRDDVMHKNGYCFFLKTQTLILKTAIFEKADYFQSNYIFSNGLLQAYSYDASGVISGFIGFFDVDIMKYKIERFFYENI